MSADLVVMRGLPGSGKTTEAHVWVEADRLHRVRVNRDSLRKMIDDGVFEEGVTERRIRLARDLLIWGMLRQGTSVICDDTNLPGHVVRDLRRLARSSNAKFSVIDLTNVPMPTCIARDRARNDKEPIGEAVIRDLHEKFLLGQLYPLPVPGQ